MGCGCINKSFIENEITEMWKRSLIHTIPSNDFVSFIKKITGLKRDLNNNTNFKKYLLNSILKSSYSLNEEIEFLKKNYLDISYRQCKNSFLIPFALLFLTKSRDYNEIYSNYLSLFKILQNNLDNPRNIKDDFPSLKLILQFYVSLVTIFSIESFSTISGYRKKSVINEFLNIYSEINIQRHLEKMFIFDNNEPPFEQVDVNIFENSKKNYNSKILNFFRNNYDKLNPYYIRECLYQFDINGFNSEEEIKKFKENNILERENEIMNIEMNYSSNDTNENNKNEYIDTKYNSVIKNEYNARNVEVKIK